MKHFKSFSVYAFTIFFNAALSFGIFSLLTHHLSGVDYGIINLYTSFSVFLTPFIAAGVPFILGVDYFKLNQQEFRNHFTNSMLIPAASTFFFTLLFFLLYYQLQPMLGANLLFIALLPITCFLTIINEICLTLFRNRGEHLLFTIFSLLKNVLESGFTVLFVLVLSYNWQGRLGSSFLALFLAALFLFFLVYKWKLLSGVVRKNLVYSIFIAGLPFIPERLAIFVLGYSDRFFINHYNGTAEVGYYGAGAQLSLVVTLAILTLNNTFSPVLFRELSLPQIDYKKVRNTTFLFIGISLLVTIAVILSIPLFFKYFIGPAFQPGQKYAVLLSIGLFFWAIYNVFISFLLNLKKNRVVMLISIAGMVISLAGNFINVPYFGPIGATYTSILVYFFMAAGTLYFVHRYYSLRKVLAF